MKKSLIFSFIILFATGCTKLGEPTMHTSDWTNANSENSHMAKIAVTGIEGCKPCHGGLEKHDYFGGSSGVSCYQCHTGGPSGHPAFNIWVGSQNSADFHGKDDMGRCVKCHGGFTDKSGGLAEVSCSTCHN
jgi:hypothetical protein